MTRDGVASVLTIHWCDLDIARLTALAPTPVAVGQVFTFAWVEPVWLAPGMADVPLPAVTIDESVQVIVPAGALVTSGA